MYLFCSRCSSASSQTQSFFFFFFFLIRVPKLNPKSLKCIFLGYSGVQKGYQCYCPNLHKYLVSIDVTFLEGVPFSSSPILTSQGKNDDLLIYIVAPQDPGPASMKPPIIEVYSRSKDTPAACPPPYPSSSDYATHDDLPIALRKGKH